MLWMAIKEVKFMKTEVNMAKTDIFDRQKRKILSKRIVAICPKCKNPIRGEAIIKNKRFCKKFQSAENFPLAHTMACEKNPDESIKLYLDANFSVRDLLLKK